MPRFSLCRAGAASTALLFPSSGKHKNTREEKRLFSGKQKNPHPRLGNAEENQPSLEILCLTPRIWAPRGIPGPSPALGAAEGAALLGQE